MSFLGDIGSLYMLFLIALLIIGLGMIAKGFINYLLKREVKNNEKNKGAGKVQSVNWLKLSLYSLVGIIVSLLMLSFISSTGLGINESSGNHSATTSGTSALGSSSTHVHSGMSSTNTLGTSLNNSLNNNLNNSLDNNNYQLQQQLSQMQYQINQLQLMIQNMNSSQTTTTPGTSSSSSSMPMM